MINHDDLHDVYAATGAAVWHLQFLEDVLVTNVTMRLRLRPKTSEAVAYSILARERRRTLGALLKDAKAAELLVGPTADAFHLLLDERNWLVHRVVNEFADNLYQTDARLALLARLRTLTDRAIELKKWLYDETASWCRSQGVDLARVDQIAVARVQKLRGA